MTAILVIITTKYSILFNQVFTNNLLSSSSVLLFAITYSPNFQSFCSYSLNLVTIWYIPITLQIDVNSKIKKKMYKMWGLKGQKFLFYPGIYISSSIYIFYGSYFLLSSRDAKSTYSVYFKESLLYATLFALLAHTYDFITWIFKFISKQILYELLILHSRLPQT